MKKFYSFTLALLASASMLVSAQSEPTSLWAGAFTYNNADGASITNIGTNIELAADGNLFILNDNGTTAQTQEVCFNGDVVAMGTDYTGTGYNHNVSLVKVNAETGKKIWSVYSLVGECSSNQGAVVATADGGAYVVLKMRHTAGRLGDAIAFKDAAGTTVTTNFLNDGTNRFYQGLILKVSAAGEIEWSRNISVDSAPMPDATTAVTSEGIYIQGARVDGSGNLYVYGRMAKDLTFAKADGTTHKLTCQSNVGWNGDAQKTVGDLYIVKLDADGYYVNSIQQQGTVTAAQIHDLAIEGNTIYAAGYIDPIDGNAVSLGGKTLQLGSVAKDIVVMCCDTDFSSDWVKVIENTATGAAVNNLTINHIGGNLWLTLKAKGTYTDGVNTLEGTLTRDGMLFQLNDGDGTWKNSLKAGINQSGFNGVFEHGDSIYVYGHSLTVAPMGLFVKAYGIKTLEAGSTWQLSSYAAAIQNMVVDGTKLYVMGRSKKGDCTVGDFTVSNANGFYSYVAAFELPFTPTAIETIDAEKTVSSVEYVNLSGVRGAQPFKGINVKITRYTDGTCSTVKVIK